MAEQATVTERHTLLELAVKAVGPSAPDITLTNSLPTGWEKALQVLNIKSGGVLLTTRSEWGGNLNAMFYLAQMVLRT